MHFAQRSHTETYWKVLNLMGQCEQRLIDISTGLIHLSALVRLSSTKNQREWFKRKITELLRAKMKVGQKLLGIKKQYGINPDHIYISFRP